MTEQYDTFLQHIARVADFTSACYAAELSPKLVAAELAEGKRLEGTNPRGRIQKERLEFWKRFKAAQATATTELISKVMTSDDWKASKWLLETRNPSFFKYSEEEYDL